MRLKYCAEILDWGDVHERHGQNSALVGNFCRSGSARDRSHGAMINRFEYFSAGEYLSWNHRRGVRESRQAQSDAEDGATSSNGEER